MGRFEDFILAVARGFAAAVCTLFWGLIVGLVLFSTHVKGALVRIQAYQPRPPLLVKMVKVKVEPMGEGDAISGESNVQFPPLQ